MRVLVTGSHKATSYDERMWLYAGLSLLHEMGPVTEVIEGGAAGYDSHAHNWVLWRRAMGDTIAHEKVEADWTKFGKAAGPIRNSEMAKRKPDVVLACPGGDGTASMVQIAEAHRLRVIRLEKMPLARPKGVATTAEPPPPPPLC